ncbi:MAG TPA: hypothetical protein VMU61_17115 [Candidatus Aquilonibacter sp.]|nr:hypothetical protein [Candidatus Aquilonibacter sp.]
MRRAGFVALAWLLFVPLALSQIPDRANIFAGYSYSDVNSFSWANGNSLHVGGWEGSIEIKAYRWVGFVGDFDRRSGTLCPGPVPSCSPGSVNVTQGDVLFGPRLSLPINRFRPFVHGLAGFQHVTTSYLGPDKSFASALGGGVDVRFARRFSWRFQGDRMQTQLFGTTQKNLRLSTGLVFRF